MKVNGNNYHSRQHIFDMTGYNWVRFNCIVGAGTSGPNCNIKMDVYDASQGTDDDFIFFGDSITANVMHKGTILSTPEFSHLINAKLRNHFPVQEDGGIISP